MAYEENAVSDQRRAELTEFGLAARGLEAAQRATVMNALREESVLPPVAQSTAGADEVAASTTIYVTGQRVHGYGLALGDHSVDRLARDTGYFVENVGKYIQDRPLVGIALEALNIAAAPVGYAVNKVIAASPIGEAIQNVQERITGTISGRFSKAGYDAEDSTAGGIGAMAVMGAVAGWGATKVLGFARNAFDVMRRERSVVVPPPSGQLNSSWIGAVPGQRVTTVSRQMSDSMQGMGYRDPLTNKFKRAPLGQTMAVDHVLPVKDIVEMRGFRSLTKDQMENILQDKIGAGNLQPLPKTLNSSKGGRGPSNPWEGYKGIPLDKDYARTLVREQVEIRARIEEQIRAYEQINRAGVR
jgi:hypothetical protein